MESLKWPSPHKTQKFCRDKHASICMQEAQAWLEMQKWKWSGELPVPPRCGLCSPVDVQMSFLFDVLLLFCERKKTLKWKENTAYVLAEDFIPHILHFLSTDKASKLAWFIREFKTQERFAALPSGHVCICILLLVGGVDSLSNRTSLLIY